MHARSCAPSLKCSTEVCIRSLPYLRSTISRNGSNPRGASKKLEKLGYSDSVQNAKDHLRDIAGIRVICYFIDDIYNLVNALKRQSELIFIREKDYIQNQSPTDTAAFM